MSLESGSLEAGSPGSLEAGSLQVRATDFESGSPLIFPGGREFEGLDTSHRFWICSSAHLSWGSRVSGSRLQAPILDLDLHTYVQGVESLSTHLS